MKITKEHIDRYTNGDCAVLALEIARLDPTWFMATTTNEDHAFVVNADKTEVIDVKGRRPTQDLLNEWGSELGFVADDFECGRSYLEDEGWWFHDGANPAQARRLAQELLARNA